MEQFKERIEIHAKSMEALGLSPVPARIYVYLMAASSSGATFEELVSFFGVSKSAVSNGLNMLIDMGLVSFKTVEGKRKRHFFLDFRKVFNEDLISSRYRMMMTMLEDIAVWPGTDDTKVRELQDAALFYKMLIVEFPVIIERWRKTVESGNP